MTNLFEQALNQTDNVSVYEGYKARLSRMGHQLDKFSTFECEDLLREADVIEAEAEAYKRTLPFSSWIKDPKFGAKKLMVEALRVLAEIKREEESTIPLIKGATYFKDVTISENGVISGKRCTYLGEDRKEFHAWIPFKEKVRKLKILETMRFGTDKDFSHLYFTLADGRPLEAPRGLVIEHLTESSEKALNEMEAYCDSRWEGAWPWEAAAPYGLKKIIKENAIMRNERIAQIRKEFEESLVELTEGEVERTEVIVASKGIADKLTNMIEQLGRISAETLTTFKDKVRTEIGDDAATQIERAASEHIGPLVDQLSDLRQFFQDAMGGNVNNVSPEGGEEAPDISGDSFSDSLAGDIENYSDEEDQEVTDDDLEGELDSDSFDPEEDEDGTGERERR
jgi:hypothetical protein